MHTWTATAALGAINALAAIFSRRQPFHALFAGHAVARWWQNVRHKFSCVRIHEAVLCAGAPTSFLLGEDCQTTKTKFRVARPANHFVAFHFPRSLVFQRIFRHQAFARRASLRPCRLSPLFQTIVRVCLLALVVLQAETLATTEAADAIASWALDPSGSIGFERYGHLAIRCWAVANIIHRRQGLLHGPILYLFQNFCTRVRGNVGLSQCSWASWALDNYLACLQLSDHVLSHACSANTAATMLQLNALMLAKANEACIRRCIRCIAA